MKNIIQGQAYRSKMQIAYDSLKEKIVTAKLRPGEPIVIGTVAQELGMSYIPVREAVQRLEGDGLIVTKPHCSPTVSEFRFEDLKEVLQVRAIMEAKATELALPNITAEKIAALERLIDGSFRELQRNNLAKVALLDREFHRLIYEETGNHFLWELIRDLWNKSDRMLGVFVLVPMRARESCEEHRQILNAIRRRDSRLAAELVAMQKMKTLESLLKYAKNPPVAQVPSPATAEEKQG
jgi:DNA-binding GntR family transcriptional regulator